MTNVLAQTWIFNYHNKCYIIRIVGDLERYGRCHKRREYNCLQHFAERGVKCLCISESRLSPLHHDLARNYHPGNSQSEWMWIMPVAMYDLDNSDFVSPTRRGVHGKVSAVGPVREISKVE